MRPPQASRLLPDPSLPLFHPRTTPGPLAELEPTLSRAEPASSRPLRLDGARVTALGTVRGPVSEIRFDGSPRVSDLQVRRGAVANALISPGFLRRERVDAGASVHEAVLVASTVPLVAVQTTAPEGGGHHLELLALPTATEVRTRMEGPVLTLAEPGSDEVLAIVGGPGRGAWTLATEAGGGVRVYGTGSGSVDTVLLAYGPEAAVRGALAAASHLSGHALRAGAGTDEELLSLHTGALELDDAVRWMETRLAYARGFDVHEASGAEPWLWVGLGATAVGDVRTAEASVDALQQADHPLLATFLAAQLARTSGKVDLLLRRSNALEPTPADDDPELRALTLKTAADALRYAWPESRITSLREAARRVASAPGPGDVTSGRRSAEPSAPSRGPRLPTVSRAPSSPPASRPESTVEPIRLGTRLTTLLGGEAGIAGGRRPDPTHPSEAALDAWLAWLRDPDEGWASWRAQVSAGLTGEPFGVGAWDPLHAGAPPAATGILLAALVHGWLGVRPDAAVGRLGISPRIPRHLTGLRAGGIVVGDARVSMSFEKVEGRRCFTFDAARGRVPPMVVFETRVEGSVRRVTVDGHDADVDRTRDGSGERIRLQTPVDSRRSIEIEVD